MASDKVDESSTTTSDDEEFLDLVQKSSVPSLAALVRAGKEQGLIQPITGYTAAG